MNWFEIFSCIAIPVLIGLLILSARKVQKLRGRLYKMYLVMERLKDEAWSVRIRDAYLECRNILDNN